MLPPMWGHQAWVRCPRYRSLLAGHQLMPLRACLWSVSVMVALVAGSGERGSLCDQPSFLRGNWSILGPGVDIVCPSVS